MTVVRQRIVRFYGHVRRHDSLQRIIPEGMVNGKRGRSRKRCGWLGNVSRYTGMNINRCAEIATNREEWRTIVSNVVSDKEQRRGERERERERESPKTDQYTPTHAVTPYLCVSLSVSIFISLSVSFSVSLLLFIYVFLCVSLCVCFYLSMTIFVFVCLSVHVFIFPARASSRNHYDLRTTLITETRPRPYRNYTGFT